MRKDKDGELKPTKVPMQLDCRTRAKSNNPETWGTFQEVLATYVTENERQNIAGIGYMFAADDPYFGIDLDACRDPATGVLTDWAYEVVRVIKSYTEVSPSGYGVKIIGRGAMLPNMPHVYKPDNVKTYGDKAAEIAIYDVKRFWTFTGQRLPETPETPQDRQGQLDALCRRLFPNREKQPPQNNQEKTNGQAAKRPNLAGALSACLKLPIPDKENDGSKRAVQVCRQLKRYALDEQQALAAFRLYETEAPFPKSWGDSEIVRRYREASVETGEAVAPERVFLIGHTMDTVEPIELDWLWPDRFPLGKVSILVGYPDTGKSYLTLDMAAKVSRGWPWPDRPHEPQPPGGVVIVSTEDDDADTICPRLLGMGADTSRIFSVGGMRVDGKWTPFMINQHLDHLAAAMDRVKPCRMIILDPITALMGKVDDRNNAELRQAIMYPLKQFAERHRVAIVGITHTRKQQGKAIHQALGSVAFTAAARYQWQLSRDPENKRRRLLLRVKGNLSDDDTSGLAFTIERVEPEGAPVIVWEADPVTNLTADDVAQADNDLERGAERREAKEWLEDLLSEGRLPTKDIQKKAREMGLSWPTVRRAKEELGVKSEKDGFKDGKWYWHLPPKALT